MITNKNEAKTMVKHISCDCKGKFNSTTSNSNQKWNNEACQCECNNYCTCKKNFSWKPSTCICENGKCLKSIGDTSVIECDEITSIMDIASTKMTNTVAKNVSKKSVDTKVKYSYIFYTVLLVIILVLIITIICYHYVKHRSKQKIIAELTV